MADRDELLAQLTGQLYEGVLTSDAWGEALQTMALVTGSPSIAIMALDPQAQISAMAQAHDIPEEAMVAYNARYHQLDDTVQFAPNLPCGGWYLDRRDMGERAMRRSTFYQEFLVPHEVDTIACNRLLASDSEEAYLSLHRRPGQQHYTHEDLAAFGQFIPHVQRAVRMRMHMQRLAQRAGLASVVLDSLQVPLLVLDEQGGILLANAQADAVLCRHPQPLAVQRGCLHPKGLRPGQFAQLLQSACGRHGRAMAGGALVPDEQGQPALQLLVLPLPAHLQTFNQWARPLALVVLGEPNPQHSVHQRLLQQLYRLTPAETRLALALCQGDAPAEAAQRLGVSVGTVRVQLRAIFAKTGTSRQTELVRTLAVLRVVG